MKWLFPLFGVLFLIGEASATNFPKHHSSLSSTLDSLPQKRTRPFRVRKSPITGTSLTYFLLDEDYSPPSVFPRHEFTWSLNMAFPINRRWEIGVNYMSIWRIENQQNQGNNWLGGVFGQFNVLQTPEIRVFM